MVEASLYHDSLVILESLKKDDKKTGNSLHNHLTANTPSSLKNRFPSIKIIYKEINNSSEFNKYLSNVLESEKIQCPIIHIEAHGSNDGGVFRLVFADSSDIGADKLGDLFRQINIKTNFNFIVSMAACYGEEMIFEFLRSVVSDKIIPFFSVIGAYKKLMPNEIEDFYINFYDLYFGNQNALESRHTDVDKLKKKLATSFPKFYIIDILEIVAVSLRAYYKNECTPDKLEMRKIKTQEGLLDETMLIITKDKISDFAAQNNTEEKVINRKIATLLAFDSVKGNRERFKDINYINILDAIIPKLGCKQK